MNIVPLQKRSTVASDLSKMLRELADKVDRGEVENFVCAYENNGEYEFLFPSSLVNSLLLASLLEFRCKQKFLV